MRLLPTVNSEKYIPRRENISKIKTYHFGNSTKSSRCSENRKGFGIELASRPWTLLLLPSPLTADTFKVGDATSAKL